jgi:hypothetical protein
MYRASLAIEVVFPAPCNPATIPPAGGCALRSRVLFSPPIICVNSDSTNLIKACDGFSPVYRPAAIKQLAVLAQQVGVDFFPSNINEKPVSIVAKAKKHAQKQFFDVLLVDTAGRLHVDSEMMDEIQVLQKKVNPIETLFVVDSMTGQDAAHTAKVFADACNAPAWHLKWFSPPLANLLPFPLLVVVF